MYTEQLSQALSIAAAPVHPQTLNNSNQSTGGVDMSKLRRCLFVIDIGAIANGGSVTAKLQESADNTNWSDVAGGSATAVTSSSKVITLEERADQLSAGKRYLRCNVAETAGQNAVCCVLPLGGKAVNKPASANDHTSVTQRLVL
jgi:hypothetical protein